MTDTLNQLVEEGEISSKSFKKKAVYWADQSKLEVLSADELKEMVASNAQLAAEAAALSEEVFITIVAIVPKIQVASLQDRNTKLSAQKKTVDIAKEIKDLEKKKVSHLVSLFSCSRKNKKKNSNFWRKVRRWIPKRKRRKKSSSRKRGTNGKTEKELYAISH